MPETIPDYANLPIEDSWVDYLRTRLPYSFRRVRKEKQRYVLSGPHLSTSWAEFHNFWQRGHVHYAVGKLIDVHTLPTYWQAYSDTHESKLRRGMGPIPEYPVYTAHDAVNALQLERLWAFAAHDHLDRERVTMTTICQAVEFCLKALQTHTGYRSTGVFAFADGHNLKVLYESLPCDLRQELHCESVGFADKFRDFGKVIEDAVSRFRRDPFAPPDPDAWKRLKDHIDEFSYTSFVNVNDPASVEALGCTPENWFETAIDSIEGITYHRYSPFQGKDKYPTTRIHRGLMLGRFMYEHLFPVPNPNTASR